MTTNKSIEVIYMTIKLKHGKIKAKSTVKAIVSNILDDLELEGLEVTEKNISARLQKYADDFSQASKSDVA
jgi:hypothetical protein